jgi:hypothetical protein
MLDKNRAFTPPVAAFSSAKAAPTGEEAREFLFTDQDFEHIR